MSNVFLFFLAFFLDFFDHCLADGCGRIVGVALTLGNIADPPWPVPLLEALARAQRLIADNAYDADRLRDWLQDRGIEAVIPGRAARPSSIRSTGQPIAAATSSSACSEDSQAESASRPATIGLPSTISPPSFSLRRLLNGLGKSPT